MTQNLPAIHTFRFNVHNFGPILVPFSVSEFNEGIDAMLTRCKYKPLEESGAFRVFASEERIEPYLIVWHVDRYDFIFYLADDDSLGEWKRKYAHMRPEFALKTLLPEPPQPVSANTIIIPINPKALR